VFEINPRFSGTTLLRALAGFNEPDLLIRKHLLGEPVRARFDHAFGTVVRGLSEVFYPAPGEPGSPEPAPPAEAGAKDSSSS
jgi:carbamoyl-phosphate synthase large subunit